VQNPIDLCGDSDDDRLLEAIRILNHDPNVDLMVTAIYFQIPYLSEYVAERIVELQGELTKPLIISPRGHSAFIFRKRQHMINRNVPTYVADPALSAKIQIKKPDRECGQGAINLERSCPADNGSSGRIDY
jgi:acyl-CoA synthetase (NDP forming)